MKNVIALTEEQREMFSRFLNLCDKYKTSWLWNNNGNTDERKSVEQLDFINYETVVNGIYYSVYFSVQLSCRNVYKTVQVARNEYITTSRVIRTLLEKDINQAV